MADERRLRQGLKPRGMFKRNGATKVVPFQSPRETDSNDFQLFL